MTADRAEDVKVHLHRAKRNLEVVLDLIDGERSQDSENLAENLNDAIESINEAVECYCSFLFELS